MGTWAVNINSIGILATRSTVEHSDAHQHTAPSQNSQNNTRLCHNTQAHTHKHTPAMIDRPMCKSGALSAKKTLIGG